MNKYGTFGDNRLPSHLQSRVDSELDKGEQLLWVGQPRPGRLMRLSLPMFLFGIPFTAFAVFWMAMAGGMAFFAGDFDHGPPGPFGLIFACFPLFGLPFLAVGLGMLSSPLWMRRKAANTFYAVTDRRAISWDANMWGSVTVRSFRAADLSKMRRTEFADGSGDLIFDEFVTLSHGTYPHGHVGHHGHIGHRAYFHRQFLGFLGIEGVREVEEIIRRVLLTEGKSTEQGIERV